MFILRRITSEGKESNQIIGEKYNLIVKESHPEEFKQALKLFYGVFFDEDMLALIIFKDGSRAAPVYKKSTYFVMTSDGNTCDNLKRLK